MRDEKTHNPTIHGYPYPESGLDNLLLDEAPSQLEDREKTKLDLFIGFVTILRANELLPRQVRFLRKSMGRTPKDLDAQLKLEPFAFVRWETLEGIPPEYDSEFRSLYFDWAQTECGHAIPNMDAVILFLIEDLPQCIYPSLCERSVPSLPKEPNKFNAYQLILQPNELLPREASFLVRTLVKRFNVKADQVADRLKIQTSELDKVGDKTGINRELDQQLRKTFIEFTRSFLDNLDNVKMLMEEELPHQPRCKYRGTCWRPTRCISRTSWLPQDE